MAGASPAGELEGGPATFPLQDRGRSGQGQALPVHFNFAAPTKCRNWD